MSTRAHMEAAPAAAKMKIGKIRDIIGNAEWSRHDLTGGTAEEFRRQDVGPRLEAKIAALQALVIPPRFVDDEARRVKEIEHCQRVIDRWNKAQEVPAKTKVGDLTPNRGL